MPVGQRHAVAGDDAAVGVLAEHASGAAGGDDDRFGFDQRELAGAYLDDHHTLHAPVRAHQIDAEIFIEAPDRRIFDRGLEQGVQHVEAGLVGSEPGALDLHAAEGAHVHMAVGLAAPGAAPVLQLHHLFGAMRHEILDHILLAEPVAAAHGVVEMVVELVVRTCHGGRTAFCRHRVAAHGVDLGDERDPERGVGLGHGDGRTQARTARPYDRDIRFVDFHSMSFDLQI